MVATFQEVQAKVWPDEHVLLHDVSWELYEHLLHDLQQQNLQLTYDQGGLEIMSPSPRHERAKYLTGLMVDIISLERRIPMRRLGSTTFRRRLLRRGLEPDQCYYIQSESKIRAKDDIDLMRLEFSRLFSWSAATLALAEAVRGSCLFWDFFPSWGSGVPWMENTGSIIGIALPKFECAATAALLWVISRWLIKLGRQAEVVA